MRTCKNNLLCCKEFPGWDIRKGCVRSGQAVDTACVGIGFRKRSTASMLNRVEDDSPESRAAASSGKFEAGLAGAFAHDADGILQSAPRFRASGQPLPCSVPPSLSSERRSGTLEVSDRVRSASGCSVLPRKAVLPDPGISSSAWQRLPTRNSPPPIAGDAARFVLAKYPR